MTNRNGFSLVELLLVLVIAGILAMVVLPRYDSARGRAYFAAMKADLRNLQAQQEIFYNSVDASASPPQLRYTYASSVDDPALGFTPSDGVKIEIQEGANSQGWAAIATHVGFGNSIDKSCAVFVGGATPVAPATTPDLVTCAGEQ